MSPFVQWLPAAFVVLSLAVLCALVARSLPSQILKRLQAVEAQAQSAESKCEKFDRERLERKAEFDAFADRCEELLDAAANKQRRAAASASRARGPAASQPGLEAQPATEEELLAQLRRRAGLNS